MVTTARSATAGISATLPQPGASATFMVTERSRSSLVDLHLRHGGALLTWAVPNGPSADPRVRRLAIACAQDDGSPITTAYDQGTVQVHGVADLRDAHRGGRITFTLNGTHLRGGFTLVHIGGLNWVLQKTDGPTGDTLVAKAPARRRTTDGASLQSARTGRSTTDHAPRRLR